MATISFELVLLSCLFPLGVHAVASSLSLCVANPPSVVWLHVCDQEPCLYGVGLFGHWRSWSCILIDGWMDGWMDGWNIHHLLQVLRVASADDDLNPCVLLGACKSVDVF